MSERAWVAGLLGWVLSVAGCVQSREPSAPESGWASEPLETEGPRGSSAVAAASASSSSRESDEPRVEIVDHGSAGTVPPPMTAQRSSGSFPDEAPPPPPVASSAPSAAPVDRAAISNAAEVVAAMRPDFASCYYGFLGHGESFEGQVRLTIVVGANGNVSDATASPRDVPTELAECLLRRARRSVFLPPEGGHATLGVPVTFVKQR